MADEEQTALRVKTNLFPYLLGKTYTVNIDFFKRPAFRKGLAPIIFYLSHLEVQCKWILFLVKISQVHQVATEYN